MSTTPTPLDGKVALITGAGGGIGRATAVAFARAGAAAVVVADLSADAAAETARQVEALDVRALAARCDVTAPDDVRALMAQTVGAFGRLDVACNNAGVEQPLMAAADIPDELWERTIDVDLRGVFLCVKHELPHLLAAGGGAIVNVSSGAGMKGFAGQAAYAAAKHGVVGLTRSVALDYAARGVRVNAVCPGVIDTEMIRRFTGGTEERRREMIADEPIGRLGTPDEIADAVVWMCSDAASFMTGHAMVVDGGQTV